MPRRLSARGVPLLAAMLFPALPLGAQTMEFQALVLEGDSVSGVGSVTRIDHVAVSSYLDWMVEADTDAADTDADSVLFFNGDVVFVENDPLPGPAGIRLDSFDSITFNDLRQSVFNFFLDGAAAGMDSSVHGYLDLTDTPANNAVVVLQEGATLDASPVLGFFDVKINRPGTILATVSVDDPAITSTVDRTLYLWTSDWSTGGTVTSTRLAAEGDVLSGQVSALTDFGTGPHETAINDDGDVLFAVDIPGADAIYHWDGAVFTEVAQEGDPSPVGGRSWSSLTSTSLDLGNGGDIVFRGTLDGDTTTNSILIKNGAKLIQEGDTLPAIGGAFTFTSFGTGPVYVDPTGNVLWFGDWNDPDTSRDTGLFLGETLIVQEGVTQIPGHGTIAGLAGITDGYQMSNDGRFIIFEATLDSGLEGAFLIRPLTLIDDGFESGDFSFWHSTSL